MASGANIYLALTDYVLALSIGSPAWPVVMPEEAETYAPPADGRYVEVSDFPNVPMGQGLKSGRLDQGLLQITAVCPKNEGLLALKQAADAIIAAFTPGQKIGPAKINRVPWQAAPIIGDSDVRIPVTISWVA